MKRSVTASVHASEAHAVPAREAPSDHIEKALVGVSYVDMADSVIIEEILTLEPYGLRLVTIESTHNNAEQIIASVKELYEDG